VLLLLLLLLQRYPAPAGPHSFVALYMPQASISDRSL
jgi:hypothetical protein